MAAGFARGLARGITRRVTDLATLRGLARSLAIYRVLPALPWRRRALARFHGRLLDEGALAFDIGAHVGSRTRALLDAGVARCVALEPQPAFAELLARDFAHAPRVTLDARAVGRAPGTARLHVSSLHPTVSTLSTDMVERVGDSPGFEHVRWDREVEVEVTTLDALIDAHGLPDFCKIDVEGHEAEILAGLSTAVPLVSVEYLPAALPVAHACIERLDALGDYRFNLCRGESRRFLHAGWLERDAIEAALDEAAADGTSGDLYARLRVPPVGARLRPVPA